MAVIGLQAWVQKLDAADLPVLGRVIEQLNELTTNADTRVNEMSDAVLKDSNLTSQLLRVANSIHYNPGGGAINTVTRAIIQVGFEGVKGICISLLLVDQLLGAQPRERLLQSMARAFHAALQAKFLAPTVDQDVAEQVFVAALLFHVGELAVWSKGEIQADQLDDQLTEGVNEHDACEAVLGLQFRSLTRELVHRWHLSSLLEQALSSSSAPSASINAIRMGEAISQVSRFGWHSKEAQQVLKQVANVRKVSLAQATADAIRIADSAGELASVFGASGLVDFIPGSQDQALARLPVKADEKIQLTVLRELSSAAQLGADADHVYQLIVRGLHHGAGLARVAVVLVLKSKLVTRYAAGPDAVVWRERLHFNEASVQLFSEALLFKAPQWFSLERVNKSEHLFPVLIKELMGLQPCFIAPIEVCGRVVALLYADANGEALTDEQYASYCHFLQQGKYCLTAQAMRVKF
ncbi:HDOD domain-containing protein [Simiduia curdlanivorans]|uniref:HDOD domain-containing protein n=1 Tax=Simiduia curdlanivorans TaxID=1492769 RepID=A0ABV8V0P1_9GAMM|nr:HDOD domain-containing protein [Simiduia curdlanivorans]MDN3637710.1 HDOD domain-containing protein [Simiduia curdlanivorans]